MERLVRPRQVYRATGAPSVDRDYRLLADVLSHHLAASSPDPSEIALAAGRSWALANDAGTQPPRTLSAATDTPGAGVPRDALEPVLRMFTLAGFSPELATDRSTVRLLHCLSTTAKATEIAPFIEPGVCRVRLTNGDLP